MGSRHFVPMRDAIDELGGIVMRAGSRWTETGLPRLRMVKSEGCPDQVYEPMLHLVLQGSKSLSIGDQVLSFQAADYLVVPVHVPATGEVRPSGPNQPYLAVSLTLEPALIASVMADMHQSGVAPMSSAFAVSPATPDMIDAWLRLMRLIDRPVEAMILAPAIEREILFRVLMGPQGDKLREIACAESRLAQVRPAVGWLRDNYAEPIRVGPLAAMTGMSVPAFYRHFKAVTSMAPIQYQKRLRLLKARRLMLFEDSDAAAAAYAVGYESASQFSREYARLFGLPPTRDAARFRLAAATPTAPKSAAQRARALEIDDPGVGNRLREAVTE